MLRSLGSISPENPPRPSPAKQNVVPKILRNLGKSVSLRNLTPRTQPETTNCLLLETGLPGQRRETSSFGILLSRRLLG
jgi:hypothetical protein